MTIPGFTAAVSLDRTDKRYQMHWTVGPADDAIYPAQGPDCFGTVAQCRDDHCAGLEGKEHGLCWNACAQPTMCEPSCSWHPESGSFSRFCYKRLPGPPGASLGCYQDCTGCGPCIPDPDNPSARFQVCYIQGQPAYIRFCVPPIVGFPVAPSL